MLYLEIYGVSTKTLHWIVTYSTTALIKTLLKVFRKTVFFLPSVTESFSYTLLRMVTLCNGRETKISSFILLSGFKIFNHAKLIQFLLMPRLHD
jgi:hypothetical protein